MTSFADTYGGKLAAAMDRQHPRDLFDVRELFAHDGITPDVRRAFVVYVASHNRPVHELLFPREKDIALEYHGAFAGMTAEPVPLDELLAVRARMMRELVGGLSDAERGFLRSLVAGEPDWALLGVAHGAQLPGVQWKLRNLDELRRKNPAKFETQALLLDEHFAAHDAPS